MDATIPFNRPSLVGNELELVGAAIQSGHSSMDGQFSTRVRELLRTELGAGHGGPTGRYEAWRDEARTLAFILATT